MLNVIEGFLQGRSFWVYCVIFSAKLIEVSCSALRSQLIVKGQRWGGALCAAIEFSFWIVITANVLEDFASDPLRIALLIIAYSLGQVVGSWLEAKLALGNCMCSDADATDTEAAPFAVVPRTVRDIRQEEGFTVPLPHLSWNVVRFTSRTSR